MPDKYQPWNLKRFLTHLDIWAELEKPDDEVRRAVLLWIMTRVDDPRKSAEPVADFPDHWFAKIPGTDRDGTIVVCSYEVSTADRVVRCMGFGTLSWPV